MTTHFITNWLPKITLGKSEQVAKNCLKEWESLFLHQRYFYVPRPGVLANKERVTKTMVHKKFLNLLFKRNLGGLFRDLFCSGCVWGGWNYFCFHFLKDKQLLLLKMLVLQTMCPRYGFKIARNRPKIRNMTMLNNNLTIWHHRQSFLKLLCFSCHD